MHSGALRHILQCAAVSPDLIQIALDIVIAMWETYTKRFLLLRQSNSVELGVKEETLELLVQGQWFVIFLSAQIFVIHEHNIWIFFLS